jgi:hypothetical protein
MAKFTAPKEIPSFAVLTRDIDWQRASFLKYCLDITESGSSEGDFEEIVVRKILTGYLVLALTFYKQVRTDLKKHYDEDGDIDAVEVKLKIQDALGKLVDEWHRVYAVISALRSRAASKESKRLLDQMSPFVDVAMKDVALSRETFPVALQFGQAYSLRYTNYIDGFAALSIPLWVLESPWEWTILWHELAGEKVRMLKHGTPGYFDAMFTSVLDQVATKKERAEIQKAGWSTDWVKELFEDSFSILHFPVHFLIVFKNLLERFPDGEKGERHPPRAVRLAIAMCLHLQLKNYETLPPNMQDWGRSEWKIWDELIDENQPGRFGEFDPNLLMPSESELKIVWLMAQKILEWHALNVTTMDKSDGKLRDTVNSAIISYTRGSDFQEVIDTARDALKKIKEQGKVGSRSAYGDSGYSILSERIGKKEKLLVNLPSDVMAAHPQVEKLLMGLGYKELLELSFFDVDFHNLNDVHMRQNNEDFWVDPTTWHNALFDSAGNAKGKFFEYDPNKPLKLGFIEIQELDRDGRIARRWQSPQANWIEIQKTEV